MRGDEDIGHYLPLLRRIIILVAVITAIPVVLWTITAFVRAYVGPPKLPTFHQLASKASINEPASTGTNQETSDRMMASAAQQAKLADPSTATDTRDAAAPKGPLLAERMSEAPMNAPPPNPPASPPSAAVAPAPAAVALPAPASSPDQSQQRRRPIRGRRCRAARRRPNCRCRPRLRRHRPPIRMRRTGKLPMRSPTSPANRRPMKCRRLRRSPVRFRYRNGGRAG